MTIQVKNYFPEEYYDHLFDILVDQDTTWNIVRYQNEEQTEFLSLHKKLYNLNTNNREKLFDVFLSIPYFAKSKCDLSFDNFGNILESYIISLPRNEKGLKIPKNILSKEDHYTIFYFIGDSDSVITLYNDDGSVTFDTEPNSLIICENSFFDITYPNKFCNNYIFVMTYQKTAEFDIYIPTEICSSCITTEINYN